MKPEINLTWKKNNNTLKTTQRGIGEYSVCFPRVPTSPTVSNVSKINLTEYRNIYVNTLKTKFLSTLPRKPFISLILRTDRVEKCHGVIPRKIQSTPHYFN